MCVWGCAILYVDVYPSVCVYACMSIWVCMGVCVREYACARTWLWRSVRNPAHVISFKYISCTSLSVQLMSA